MKIFTRLFFFLFTLIFILLSPSFFFRLYAQPTKTGSLKTEPLALECQLKVYVMQDLAVVNADAKKKKEKVLKKDFKFSLTGLQNIQTTLEDEAQVLGEVAAENKSTWEFKGLVLVFENEKKLNYQINGRFIETKDGEEKPLRELQIPSLRHQPGVQIKKIWPIDRTEIFELLCQ